MGIDWVTVSSLATAGAPFVVAVATFATVRSSIQVARNAERALQVGLRPVLFPSCPGDENMWLAAIRTPDDPDRSTVLRAMADHTSLFVDLLYCDQEGGQRTISRFVVSQDPADPDAWLCGVVRHWFLDREDPR